MSKKTTTSASVNNSSAEQTVAVPESDGKYIYGAQLNAMFESAKVFTSKNGFQYKLFIDVDGDGMEYRLWQDDWRYVADTKFLPRAIRLKDGKTKQGQRDLMRGK